MKPLTMFLCAGLSLLFPGEAQAQEADPNSVWVRVIVRNSPHDPERPEIQLPPGHLLVRFFWKEINGEEISGIGRLLVAIEDPRQEQVWAGREIWIGTTREEMSFLKEHDPPTGELEKFFQTFRLDPPQS